MILGVDPGFANFGYCLADNCGDVIEMATIRTKKTPGLSTAQDIISRCQDIYEHLRYRIRKNGEGLYGLCIEGMSFPRNASSAVKLGASHGIIASLAGELMPEVIAVLSPQEIRKTITGKAKGYTEEETHALLRLDPDVNAWVKRSKKWEIPHALDARAAMCAAEMQGYFV